jgi:hypothetical protein
LHARVPRQETHQWRGDVEKLQHRRRAETHLPAQWLVAGIKTLAPRRELRLHAPHDAGILPEFHGHSRLVRVVAAGSDG